MTGNKRDDEAILYCESCGVAVDENIEYYEEDGMCDECSFVCSHCGDRESIDNMYMDNRDEAFCERCTSQCERCGKTCSEHSIDVHISGDYVFCRHCTEYVYFCASCGTWIDHESMYTCGTCEKYYCESCYFDSGSHDCDNNDYGLAHADYCPSFLRYKPSYDDSLLYHGIELEVDGVCDMRGFIDKLNDLDGEEKLFYLKEDGSLTEDGLEIVTHPMTIQYHREYMPWEDLFQLIDSYADTYWIQSRCGLHIHSSKKYYTKLTGSMKANLNMFDLAIYKLIYVFDRFWPELYNFSRRKSVSYCNRPTLLEKECRDTLSIRYGVDSVPKRKLTRKDVVRSHRNKGKYMAIRQTSNTIETRLWCGTGKLNELMASLEMTNGLHKTIKNTRLKKIKQMNWKDLCDSVMQYDEPECLKSYLEGRDLLCA